MENQDVGRVASGRALASEAPAGLQPTAFDPSRFEPHRYEGKPRWLPRSEKRLLRTFLDTIEARLADMSDREQTELLCACLNVSPINCAWDEYAMAEIVYHLVSHDVAFRDSDRSGEAVETLGSTEGESAGRQASPNPSREDHP